MFCRAITALLAFVLPSVLARPALNLLGFRLSRRSRIGFSLVFCRSVALDEGARIGHLNIINVNRLVLRTNAYIGRANLLWGPFDVLLGPSAGIGSENRLQRGRRGISSGPSRLVLGELAKITASHRVDCTQSVRLGAFTTLAGAGSQIWTHGYMHETSGAGRYRIDGRVTIEDNVYIGSACFISMGVRIARGIVVGGGTAVSHSLVEPGLYVSAPIRHLPRPLPPETRTDLRRLEDPALCETVFLKRDP